MKDINFCRTNWDDRESYIFCNENNARGQTGCSGKNCVFHIHCIPPSPAYRCKISLEFSTQCAQSLIFACHFLYNHSSPVMARERLQILKILGKKHNFFFLEHMLVLKLLCAVSFKLTSAAWAGNFLTSKGYIHVICYEYERWIWLWI